MTQTPPLFYSTQADKGFGTLAFDPITLLRLMATDSHEVVPPECLTTDSELPANLRGFLDFRTGPNLRRKLLQLLVMNRGWESWRRANRVLRMSRWLNLPAPAFESLRYSVSIPEPPEWAARLEKMGILAIRPVTDTAIVQSMPRARGEPPVLDRGQAATGFALLPAFITSLLRLDFFITAEENGLFLETHTEWPAPPKTSHSQELAPPPRSPAWPTRTPSTPEPAPLDFDR